MACGREGGEFTEVIYPDDDNDDDGDDDDDDDHDEDGVGARVC